MVGGAFDTAMDHSIGKVRVCSVQASPSGRSEWDAKPTRGIIDTDRSGIHIDRCGWLSASHILYFHSTGSAGDHTLMPVSLEGLLHGHASVIGPTHRPEKGAMSLQRKFALLLVLLGVGVLINIAVAVWSVGLLDREQRWPSEQIGSVLSKLDQVDEALWDQARVLGIFAIDSPQPPSDLSSQATPREIAGQRFANLGRRALEALDDMERIESYALRSGVNTTRNLRSRIKLWTQLGSASLASDDPDAAAHRKDQALREYEHLHTLIGRLQTRLVNDAKLSTEYAAQVRHRLLLLLGGSVVSVISLLLAAAWFFRRWVLLRLEELRKAALELGQGHLDYRVAVAGDDELDRVGTQLNDMASTIARMQQERIERERLAAIGEMTRCLAHNIRNPLAGIRSLAELSASELDEASPTREHQSRIILAVDRFVQWLNELLSISNPLAVEPQRQPIKPWLEGLIEALKPMAQSHGVTLELAMDDSPDVATFDQRHLEQAVLAIVTNAVEISPDGSTVTIESLSDEKNHAWLIRIADQGPGIDQTVKDELFKPYFTTKQGGTGIGLAQCLRIVRGHDGEIWALNRSDLPDEPEKSEGAVFLIRLPLGEQPRLVNTGHVCGDGEANNGHDSPA